VQQLPGEIWIENREIDEVHGIARLDIDRPPQMRQRLLPGSPSEDLDSQREAWGWKREAQEPETRRSEGWHASRWALPIVRIGVNLESAAKRRSGNMLRVHRDRVEYPAVRLADRLAHDSSCRRPAQLRLPQPLSGVPTAAVFLPLGIRSLGAGPAQVDGV